MATAYDILRKSYMTYRGMMAGEWFDSLTDGGKADLKTGRSMKDYWDNWFFKEHKRTFISYGAEPQIHYDFLDPTDPASTPEDTEDRRQELMNTQMPECYWTVETQRGGRSFVIYGYETKEEAAALSASAAKRCEWPDRAFFLTPGEVSTKE